MALRCATIAVTPHNVSEQMSKTSDKNCRARLVTLRNELVELSEATNEDRAPVELDQQSVGRLSRMDALQEQAMQLETERRRQQTIARVDAALIRLDDGEYGFCISCGDEISDGRLDQDPTVPTCIKCAS